jgi:hypothetical protein
MKKICFVASSGGHLQELLCLQELMNNSDSFLVTENDGIVDKGINVPTYYVPQINRKEKNFFVIFFNCFFVW